MTTHELDAIRADLIRSMIIALVRVPDGLELIEDALHSTLAAIGVNSTNLLQIAVRQALLAHQDSPQLH